MTFDPLNVPADIAMMRFSQMEMPMLNHVDEVEDQVSLPSVVFPNPATELIFVKYDGKDNEDIAINVYDLNGKIVFQEPKRKMNRGNIISFNIAGLSNGVYCVQLLGNGIQNIHKIIKQ